MSQKRKYYRLTYSPGRCPTFTVGGKSYQVLDLSEKGVRFRLPPSVQLDNGAAVGGILDFPGGDSCKVRGSVLRTQGSDCIVELTQGVPLPIIMNEQRRLIRLAKGD